MIQFILTILLIPSFAFAGKIQVIFFGGYAAGNAQMKQWHQALTNYIEANDLDPSAYNLREIPYPSGVGWDKRSALRGGASVVSSISQEMNDPENAKTKYILVGHSSGSAISNAIGLRAKNPSRLTHVVLDGFRPDKLMGDGQTICYTAHSKENPGLGAPNRRAMLACADPEDTFNEIPNKKLPNNVAINLSIDQCRDQRCLHFSVLNANPKIGKISFRASSSRYYDDLILKAGWLPRVPQTAPNDAADKSGAAS